MSLRSLALQLGVLVLLALNFPGSVNALTLAVDSDLGQVSVTGATADGEVVLLAVERVRHLYWSEVRRGDYRELADSSGDVLLTPIDGVAWASVWVAVDLATGDSVVATPAGYPLRQLSAGTAAASVSGTSVNLTVAAAEVVIVRPGVGRWIARLRDGGGGDSGVAHDGSIQLALVDLASAPQESTPLPTGFSAGDLVVGIDPQRLEVFIQEVGS
ncbi:MAG: hypothetical protein AAGD01_11405 [Acidobacteriota bacterium]